MHCSCSFDAERSPLHRSSPNPKKIFREEETHKNKSDSTSLNNNKHAGHKDLSRRSATPQRSSYVLVVEVTTKVGVSFTSLPLSKQPQRSLEVSTKKSSVIQTFQGSSTRWKLLVMPSRLGFQESKSNRCKSNQLDKEIKCSSLPK